MGRSHKLKGAPNEGSLCFLAVQQYRAKQGRNRAVKWCPVSGRGLCSVLGLPALSRERQRWQRLPIPGPSLAALPGPAAPRETLQNEEPGAAGARDCSSEQTGQGDSPAARRHREPGAAALLGNLVQHLPYNPGSWQKGEETGPVSAGFCPDGSKFH